jgi:hypothetical protein
MKSFLENHSYSYQPVFSRDIDKTSRPQLNERIEEISHVHKCLKKEYDLTKETHPHCV